MRIILIACVLCLTLPVSAREVPPPEPRTDYRVVVKQTQNVQIAPDGKETVTSSSVQITMVAPSGRVRIEQDGLTYIMWKTENEDGTVTQIDAALNPRTRTYYRSDTTRRDGKIVRTQQTAREPSESSEPPSTDRGPEQPRSGGPHRTTIGCRVLTGGGVCLDEQQAKARARAEAQAAGRPPREGYDYAISKTLSIEEVKDVLDGRKVWAKRGWSMWDVPADSPLAEDREPYFKEYWLDEDKTLMREGHGSKTRKAVTDYWRFYTERLSPSLFEIPEGYTERHP